MATRARLEQALINADAAGDIEAAKAFASAIRNGEYDDAEKIATADDVPVLSAGQQAAPDQQGTTFADVANEAMSAVNRGGINAVDMLGFPIREPINAALRIADVDYQIPTLRASLADTRATVEGGQMKEGLARDVIRGAGEMALPSGLVGGGIRQVAQAVTPQLTAANANAILPNIGRQLAQGSAVTDAQFGAISGAGSAVGQEVGGDRGAMIGSVVAPLAVAAAPQTAGAAIKKAFAGGNQEQIAKTIDDFAFIGETPTVGMATGSAGLQKAETVSGSVMGGGKIRTKHEAIADSIQKRVASMADNLSEKEGAEAAGLEIKKGIQGRGGFLDRFRTTSSALWNKSDQLISPELQVDTANTKAMLGQLVRGDNVGAILDNPKLIQLQQVLDNSPTVDYQTLKSLRSSIGQKIGNNELISDIPRAELKRVYGALTQDIKAAAANSSPEALKAFERANAYTRTGHERIDDYLERIVSKVDTDKIFNAVAKGGEGTKTINAVKRSLQPEEWEVVASNVVRKMGRANSGAQNAEGDAFSVDKFVTDWDKLGPARKALFSGSPKLDSYHDDLAKIARIASTVKTAGKQGANYSGTAQAASRIAAGTGLATGVMSASPTLLSLTAGSIAMNNAGARLMTNPNFVKWLAQTARVPAKNSSAAIGALVGVANQSSSDDAAIIQQLVEELESQK